MKMKTLACLVCLGLAGCSPFKSNQPPPTLYVLHAVPPVAAPPVKALKVIAVPEPMVPSGFESDKFVIYLQGGRRMDYAAGAAWPTSLPKVLQDFIVQSARAVPGLMAVTSDSGIPAGPTLIVRVNDFEPIYTGDAKDTPGLKASMTFTLLSQNARILESFTITRENPAARNTLSDIASGLETMLQDMTIEAYGKMKPALFRKAPNAPHML